MNFMDSEFDCCCLPFASVDWKFDLWWFLGIVRIVHISICMLELFTMHHVMSTCDSRVSSEFDIRMLCFGLMSNTDSLWDDWFDFEIRSKLLIDVWIASSTYGDFFVLQLENELWKKGFFFISLPLSSLNCQNLPTFEMLTKSVKNENFQFESLQFMRNGRLYHVSALG